MSISIQVLSDIHLEQSNQGKCFLSMKVLSPYLFLVGDIGHVETRSWRDFIGYCARSWKQIFVVLGNHEYYSVGDAPETMTDLEKRYDEWFRTFPNIFWVRPGCSTALVDHPDVHVIGGTGWSKPSHNTKSIINDFHHIYVTPERRISPDTMRELHEEAFGYIFTEIEKYPGRQYIVATHFPPIYHGVTHPSYDNGIEPDPANTYFRNDYTIRSPNIRAWLFGHTHYSTVLQTNRILYISNQFGRPSERNNAVFRRNAFFYI